RGTASSAPPTPCPNTAATAAASAGRPAGSINPPVASRNSRNPVALILVMIHPLRDLARAELLDEVYQVVDRALDDAAALLGRRERGVADDAGPGEAAEVFHEAHRRALLQVPPDILRGLVGDVFDRLR